MSKKPKCKLCTSLSDRQLEQIAQELAAGTAPETIAGRFRVDYDDLMGHSEKCLAKPEARPNDAILSDLLEKLVELVDLAKSTYEEDPNRSDMLLAVTSTMREARDTLKQIQDGVNKDPEEILQVILKTGLNPLVSAGMRGLATEWSKQRAELTAAGVKPEVLEAVGRGLLSAYGQSMKQGLRYAVEQLGTELGIPKKRIAGMIAAWDTKAQLPVP